MNSRAPIALPLVACIESFLSPTFNIPSSPSSPALHLLPAPTLAKLKNLSHARIRDMRHLGHTIQVISHIPISVTPQMCSKLNDALEPRIRLQADKLVALALLPGGPGEGKDAAAELQRCVTKMKFVGGVIAVGRGVVDRSFEEVWSVAQRLGVPIVLREEWLSVHQVCCVLAMRRYESRLMKRTLTVADQRVYAGPA